MKKVGFIGAYDKTNMLLGISKILTSKSKRVLIIDTTIEQKLKYIVPTIHPTKTYITTWEDIDIAIGFSSYEEIYRYAGIQNLESEYDVIFIEIDTINELDKMNIRENDMNFFVTAMDLYSIRKGIEIFSNPEEQIKLNRIIFSREMNAAEEEYIDYLTAGYPIIWNESIIFFPLILEDRYVEMESQLLYKVDLKSISPMYKDSLAHLIASIFRGEISEMEARKIIRTLEKDGV